MNSCSVESSVVEWTFNLANLEDGFGDSFGSSTVTIFY